MTIEPWCLEQHDALDDKRLLVFRCSALPSALHSTRHYPGLLRPKSDAIARAVNKTRQNAGLRFRLRTPDKREVRGSTPRWPIISNVAPRGHLRCLVARRASTPALFALHSLLREHPPSLQRARIDLALRANVPCSIWGDRVQAESFRAELRADARAKARGARIGTQ